MRRLVMLVLALGAVAIAVTACASGCGLVSSAKPAGRSE